MNCVNLLPAVTAYCQERIRELDKAQFGSENYGRREELKSMIRLCEGLERQQVLLTDLVNRPAFGDRRHEGVG